MPTTSHHFSPFIPDDTSLLSSMLPDKAVSLSVAAAKLAGSIAPETRNTISRHMEVINSYYSNLIEGNRTQPYEIRAAQRGHFSNDPAKKDFQLESIAHIKVQQWLNDQAPENDTLYLPEFIRAIHREFYRYVPETLRVLKNNSGNTVDHLIPGEWRTKKVIVGTYVPPAAEDIAPLMKQYYDIYNPNRFSGDRKMIAVICAHHRFAWIHPFADGNGRVMRLLTDVALKNIGMESVGIWCLSRGLARSFTHYKAMLQAADAPRQGNLDGRRLLSQAALIQFCDFILDTARDQVDYVSDLLDLDNIYHRIQNYIRARNEGRVAKLGKIKEIAALVLYNAFISGHLKRVFALELCAMPERSARRLLAQLRDEGLLSEKSARSALTWEIPEHAEPWYFPQLTPEFNRQAFNPPI